MHDLQRNVSCPATLANLRREPAMWRTDESEHYIFHFRPGSVAAAEIAEVAKLQESCYAEICAFLGVSPPWKICYFLCDSQEEVGRCYGDGVPINTSARQPNLVYAAYNEQVRCVG